MVRQVERVGAQVLIRIIHRFIPRSVGEWPLHLGFQGLDVGEYRPRHRRPRLDTRAVLLRGRDRLLANLVAISVPTLFPPAQGLGHRLDIERERGRVAVCRELARLGR